MKLDDLKNLSYFDALACLGDISFHCGGIQNTAELLFSANVHGHSTVLEIGCGTGASTKALLNIGLNVTVVEPSCALIKTMLQNCINATRKCPIHYNIPAEEMDMVPTNSYDVVLLECVFGFLKNKQKSMEHIFRVLKKGGVVAVTDFYYKTTPPSAIATQLEEILGIDETLFQTDWQAYFKNLKPVHWSEIEPISGHFTRNTVQESLKSAGLYKSFPYGDTGINILSEKFLNWNNLFIENKKYMSSFNAVWKK